MSGSWGRSRILSIIATVVVVSVILSGCTTGLPNGASDDENTQTTWNVTALKVPMWEIGQWWRYEGSDGITYTHRVEGVEERHGFETYRVRVELSEPDELGFEEYVLWFDTETLAQVATEQGGFYGWWDCPVAGVFPIQALEGPCYREAGRGGRADFTEHYNITKTPRGWTNLTLPSGTHVAYHIDTRDDAENETLPLWYSPELELVVQKEWAKGLLSLTDWGEPEASRDSAA